MKLDYKKMLKALSSVEEERNIPEAVVREALCEAIAKAYKKDAELSDIDVYAQITDKTIDLYQNYTVVEEVEDDELEISLEDAKAYKSDAELGDIVARPIEIETMSRVAASLARNVMRQKIREAEKVAVYNEYVDQLNELVLGVVESVKDKFALINLGKTVAMMPKSAQMPNEILREGQQIRVVITEVNKETKGSQVLVSRSDAMFVKRLFEKDVPEIYDGVVEIKAIARDAGERTKMAVISHNPDVDPIGACIGPRGDRVNVVIDELHGEKIDIFQWNDDLSELVKNALAPAVVKAVLPSPNDERALLVIVDDDQLSLAIGKRGKNARLAVKLTNRKIDIKTRAEIEEQGIDYEELVKLAEIRRAERKNAVDESKKAEAALAEAEERKRANAHKLAAAKALQEELLKNEGMIPEEMADTVSDKLMTKMSYEDEEETETPAEEATAAPVETETVEAEETIVETVVEEPVEEAEETAEEIEETPVKPAVSKHANLEEMAANNTYVSAFEKLADTSKPKQEISKFKKKKKKAEEDEYKVSNKELAKQLKADLADKAAAAKPIYSDEELAEIEAEQEREFESEYDIDYDDYEEYYDEDNY